MYALPNNRTIIPIIGTPDRPFNISMRQYLHPKLITLMQKTPDKFAKECQIRKPCVPDAQTPEGLRRGKDSPIDHVPTSLLISFSLEEVSCDGINSSAYVGRHTMGLHNVN